MEIEAQGARRARDRRASRSPSAGRCPRPSRPTRRRARSGGARAQGGLSRRARAWPEAFERALEALAQRSAPSAELGAWLAQARLRAGEIADAVERLVAAGALDDARFARRFAEDKRELRGWGPERIREALAERGSSGS